jgi:hypothetical protein
MSHPMRWGNRYRLFCEQLEDRVVPDSAGPRILSHTPTQVINATLDHIDIQFNEAIDAASLQPADVAMSGPAGPVVPTSTTVLTADTFRVTFSPLTFRGSYRLAIGPDVRDLAGNPMDQNQNGVNGETTDTYAGSFVFAVADAVFTSATLIGETNLAYEGKNILINGATVTIDGPHSFGSVHLINGAVLTHTANTATQTHALVLTVSEQVIVDATSRIDVSGKGCDSGGWFAGGSYGGLVGHLTRDAG